MTNLREFIIDFFSYYKSEISNNNGELCIKLSEELAQHFKKDNLRLVFHPNELNEDNILVSHGSWVLNQIFDFMQNRGIGAVGEIPITWKDKRGFPIELNLKDSELQEIHTNKIERYCVTFNFKIEFHSDEKIEEIYSLYLDWDGKQREQPKEFSLPSTYDSLPSAEISKMYEMSIKLVEEYSIKKAVDYEREILQRLYKQIKRLNSYYQEQIDELQRRAEERSTSELTEQIEKLRKEFKLKVSEETENHRLRINISLVNYFVWIYPFLKYQIDILPNNSKVVDSIHNNQQDSKEHFQNTNINDTTLETEKVEIQNIDESQNESDKTNCNTEIVSTSDAKSPEKQTIQLIVFRDLHTGILEYPLCFSCNNGIKDLFTCVNKHIVCSECLITCSICGRRECKECGSIICSICQKPICSQCKIRCVDCGKYMCAEHSNKCSVCDKDVCTECSTKCSICGKISCSTHSVKCSHCKRNVDINCTKKCTNCNVILCEDDIKECQSCGQIFGVECLTKCSICDKELCPSHSLKCANCGKAYCSQHLEEYTIRCVVGDEIICKKCSTQCSICKAKLCKSHITRCSVCRRVICNEHLKYCAMCKKPICTDDAEQCSSCNEVICNKHFKTCEICDEKYCEKCLSGKVCNSCYSFRKAAILKSLPDSIMSLFKERKKLTNTEKQSQSVASIKIDNYSSWRKISTSVKTLYLGLSKSNSGLLIVVDKDENLIRIKQLSYFDIIRIITLG